MAVIGKKVKNVSEDEALDCVFGYTIGNDVSERSWQRSDRTMWRSKNSDTFKPMGPWIETKVNLRRMITTVRINDEVVSEFPTNSMLFGIAGIHQHHEPEHHTLSRGRNLDGHGRSDPEPEAWRRGGGGDKRHRNPQEIRLSERPHRKVFPIWKVQFERKGSLNL